MVHLFLGSAHQSSEAPPGQPVHSEQREKRPERTPGSRDPGESCTWSKEEDGSGRPPTWKGQVLKSDELSHFLSHPLKCNATGALTPISIPGEGFVLHIS